MSGMALPYAAYGQYRGLEGTPHDFRSLSPTSTEAGTPRGACAFCHLPTGESKQEGQATAYQMYGLGSMGTQSGVGPSGVSLLCLSCHDGMSAGDVTKTQGPSLGTDLSNDHPVSMEYDEYGASALHSVSDVLGAGLKLPEEGGELRVECTSCHDPHDNRWGSFLRLSNDGSRLCFTCHDK